MNSTKKILAVVFAVFVTQFAAALPFAVTAGGRSVEVQEIATPVDNLKGDNAHPYWYAQFDAPGPVFFFRINNPIFPDTAFHVLMHFTVIITMSGPLRSYFNDPVRSANNSLLDNLILIKDDQNIRD